MKNAPAQRQVVIHPHGLTLDVQGSASVKTLMQSFHLKEPITVWDVAPLQDRDVCLVAGGWFAKRESMGWTYLNTKQMGLKALVPISISADQTNGLLYVTTCDSIAISSDGGMSWKEVQIPIQDINKIRTSVDGWVFVRGRKEIFVSDNRGQRWDTISHTRQISDMIVPYDISGCVFFVDTLCRVFVATKTDNNWSVRMVAQPGLTNAAFYSESILFVSTPDYLMCYTAQDGFTNPETIPINSLIKKSADENKNIAIRAHDIAYWRLSGDLYNALIREICFLDITALAVEHKTNRVYIGTGKSVLFEISHQGCEIIDITFLDNILPAMDRHAQIPF